jgi:hypothetical protein
MNEMIASILEFQAKLAVLIFNGHRCKAIYPYVALEVSGKSNATYAFNESLMKELLPDDCALSTI